MIADALTPVQAARRAHIRNLNAAKRAPLFAAAGLIEQVTPDDVISEHEAFLAHLHEIAEREAQQTAAMRAILVQLVGEETVAQWDAHARRVYPVGSEYVRGHYRMQYRKWRKCQTHCIWCADDCPLALQMRGTRGIAQSPQQEESHGH